MLNDAARHIDHSFRKPFCISLMVFHGFRTGTQRNDMVPVSNPCSIPGWLLGISGFSWICVVFLRFSWVCTKIVGFTRIWGQKVDHPTDPLAALIETFAGFQGGFSASLRVFMDLHRFSTDC